MNVSRAKAKLVEMRRDIDDLLEELGSAEVEAAPEWMSPARYARHRDVSVSTIQKWRKLGMPAQVRGRTVRIPVKAADAWSPDAAIAADAARAALGGSR